MRKIVFYSWQSDLPNKTNRGFIESAIQEASVDIEKDGVVIDRDTKGVPGAPDISSTIFAKIEAADVFVADVSIILKPENERPIPNPNVLIELGYALKALGPERIVLVFNESFGKTQDLPFDLKTRRLLVYKCPEDVTDRSSVKSELVKDFKAALSSSFSHSSKPEEMPTIVDIIQNNPANKVIKLREYLSHLLKELKALEPTMFRDGGTVEELIEGISKTQAPLAAFAKLCETVSLMNDVTSAEEIFKWFGKIHEFYYPPANESGKISDADGDFFKFIGHEMFVTFISFSLKEEKWEELAKILEWQFKSENNKYHKDEEKYSWTELSRHSLLLEAESKKRNRLDLHSDILHERHGAGGLSSILPFKDFSEADVFLFLYGSTKREETYYSEWYPRSIVWFDHTPSFIKEAEDYPFAMKVAHILKINDIDEFKRRLAALSNLRRATFPPISTSQINKIGSTGGAKIIHIDE